MIPVEVTSAPWHATGFWDWLDHWQTLIAGGFALLAGVGTVAVTMIIARKQIAMAIRLERERVLSEVDALRKSLAVELRQQIARALSVRSSLHKLGSKPEGPITARMVESLSRMPAPIIYSANAGKIGLLGDDAMDVAMVYTLLEGTRGRVDRLATNYRTPDNIDPTDILSIAEGFLEACKRAQRLLPRLRTGVASYDAQDEALTRQIDAALAAGQA